MSDERHGRPREKQPDPQERTYTGSPYSALARTGDVTYMFLKSELASWIVFMSSNPVKESRKRLKVNLRYSDIDPNPVRYTAIPNRQKKEMFRRLRAFVEGDKGIVKITGTEEEKEWFQKNAPGLIESENVNWIVE